MISIAIDEAKTRKYNKESSYCYSVVKHFITLYILVKIFDNKIIFCFLR